MTAEIHALAGAYVLEAVPDTERATFERHLGECEACAAEVAELRETAARLADHSWSVPPPGLRERVLALVARTRQLPPRQIERTISATRAGSRWRRWTAAAAAAAVLAAGAGGTGYALQQQRVDDARQAAEQARRHTDRVQAVLAAPDARLRQGEVAGGGRLTLVASARQDAGVVMLTGAEAAGPGRAYQLWLIDDSGPAPAGLLAGAGTLLLDGLAGARLLGLTVEPAGGSATPTEPILATLPVA